MHWIQLPLFPETFQDDLDFATLHELTFAQHLELQQAGWRGGNSLVQTLTIQARQLMDARLQKAPRLPKFSETSEV